MMKNKFTFLIILFSINFCLCKNYCEIEIEFCDGVKHVACDKNLFDFNSDEFFQNYTIFNITNSGKNQLLQSINLYRNSIALGHFSSFEKASNMRMMKWDDELEYMVKVSLEKLHPNKFECVDTENFNNPGQFYFPLFGKFSEEEFIHQIFTDLQSRTISRNSNDWAILYMATNHKIGCGYVNYYDKEHGYVTLMRCVTNKLFAGNDNTKNYIEGEPCSNCEDWEEKCSSRYSGLCGE